MITYCLAAAHFPSERRCTVREEKEECRRNHAEKMDSDVFGGQSIRFDVDAGDDEADDNADDDEDAF